MFHNRIRLPITIAKAQFPETRNVYRKSNGDTVTQSVVIRKVYQGATDHMSERLHERLKIALGHDFLQLETENYYGRIVQAGDYAIDWIDFLNHPLAMAKVDIEVTPFNATNANCKTCEEANSVICADDNIGDLDEDTDYAYDVIANDSICCFPSTYSITSFNTTFLDSATIDSSGVIHIHTKASLTLINNLNLLTYRVTCPDGSFDEANVFGTTHDTDASDPAGCLAPPSITGDATTTSLHVTWVEPSPLPDHYFWKLWNNTTFTYDQSGDLPVGTTDILLTGLSPATHYTFYIRGQCDATDDDATASNFTQLDSTLSPETALCGQYAVALADPNLPSAGAGGHVSVPYVDCLGVTQTIYIPNGLSRTFCAMQSSAGVPNYIGLYGPGLTLSYLTLC